MNDNPPDRLYCHRLGHARRLRHQRDSPPKEVNPHWYDIHPVIDSPAVYAFVKQRGIFISGIPSYFIRLQ